MKKAFFVLLTLIFILINAKTFAADNAKIFCINLYGSKIDFRLGEEKDPVFFMNGLDSFNSTSLLSTSKTGIYTFYFKESTEKKYYFWAKDGKTPEKCPVESGKIYCFVIGVDGSVEYYILTEGKDDNPKVCFLNGSDTDMSRMEVSKSWKNNPVAYVDNLKQNAITNFVSVAVNNYSAYWQFPVQVKTSEYYFYPDKSGKNAEIFSFKKGNYFIFLAYTYNREDYAVIWDITP